MTLACIRPTQGVRTTTDQDLERRVEAVRRFNRFYTAKIGVLGDRRAWSSLSLTQVRVLYELAHRDDPTAAELSADLGVDQGHLSRVLADFAKRGYLRRTRSVADGRASHLALTSAGRAALAPLDARARREITTLLRRRTAGEQARVLDAMRVIEETLGDAPPRTASFVIRRHRAGDLGWIVHRHGALYAEERGWNGGFEALVAGIVADFAKGHDSERERCWIAEQDGRNVGSVLLAVHSKTIAQLRLLLVEPSARGRGLGEDLVDECVRFARQANYARVRLWTAAELVAARRLYERIGFRVVDETGHTGFGRPIVGQTWELAL
jgi:DNA-binding MarR family transcriptional regulator/N-acetylglutamate synthase-like GNAT family acetyltransferase